MSTKRLIFRNFRNYFTKNMLVGLALYLALSPIFISYYNSQSDALIAGQQAALDSSTELLNNQLEMLSSLLEYNCSSDEMRIFAQKSHLRSEDYITLQAISNSVRTLCASNTIVSDIFIVFENNDTVITKLGNFTTLGLNSGKASYLNYYTFSNPDFIEAILEPPPDAGKLFCLNGLTISSVWSQPTDIAFVYGKQLSYSSSRIYVYMMVSQENLEALFSVTDGQVMLYGVNDQPLTALFSDAQMELDANDRFTLFSPVFTYVRSGLKIDQTNHWLFLRSVLLSMLLYSVIAFVISFVISATSSYYSCKPLRRLVGRLCEANPDMQNYKEAFSYLLDSMKIFQEKQNSMAMQIQDLQSSVTQGRIDRYLRSPVMVLTDASTLPELPGFPSHYVLGYLILHIDESHNEQTELGSLAMMIGSRLAAQLNAIFHPLDAFSSVLIIPAVSDQDNQLVRLRQLMRELNQSIDLPASIVISHVCEGIHQLNSAYESVRAAVVARDVQTGVFYADKDKPSVLPHYDPRHLSDAVAEANYPLACEILQELMSDAYAYLNLSHRFRFAQTLLRLAAYKVDPQLVDNCIPFDNYMMPDQLVKRLKDFARVICQSAATKNESLPNIEDQTVILGSRDRIIGHINEHFGESELSVQTVCEDCAINEKQLNAICRVTVGMNALAYIRQLRIDKAASLLRNTDIKVVEIVKMCGYNTPNAFYKAFKQLYGKSPSEYRAMYQHGIMTPAES